MFVRAGTADRSALRPPVRQLLHRSDCEAHQLATGFNTLQTGEDTGGHRSHKFLAHGQTGGDKQNG